VRKLIDATAELQHILRQAEHDSVSAWIAAGEVCRIAVRNNDEKLWWRGLRIEMRLSGVIALVGRRERTRIKIPGGQYYWVLASHAESYLKTAQSGPSFETKES